jgi:MYND finger
MASDPDLYSLLLNGTWKGIYIFDCILTNGQRPNGLTFGGEQLSLSNMMYLIWVFPTNREARAYFTFCVKTGWNLETVAPTFAEPSKKTAKKLQDLTSAKGSGQIQDIFVCKGDYGQLGFNLRNITVMAVVGNVVTKFTLSSFDNTLGQFEIIAKGLVFVETQLLAHRSEEGDPLRKAHHHHDLMICSFCGDGSKHLGTCSRCRLARYCSSECQESHHAMKGPNGHRGFCKAVAKAKGN